MPLTEEQFATDLTVAMKARDGLRTNVLRGVITAAKNLRVERRGAALDETSLAQVIRREVRKREEALEFAEKGSRADLVAQCRAELEVLAAYAPAGVAPAEIEGVVREVAQDPARRQMGVIMGILKQRFEGRLDGKQASEIVRRVLAEPPR